MDETITTDTTPVSDAPALYQVADGIYKLTGSSNIEIRFAKGFPAEVVNNAVAMPELLRMAIKAEMRFEDRDVVITVEQIQTGAAPNKRDVGIKKLTGNMSISGGNESPLVHTFGLLPSTCHLLMQVSNSTTGERYFILTSTQVGDFSRESCYDLPESRVRGEKASRLYFFFPPRIGSRLVLLSGNRDETNPLTGHFVFNPQYSLQTTSVHFAFCQIDDKQFQSLKKQLESFSGTNGVRYELVREEHAFQACDLSSTAATALFAYQSELAQAELYMRREPLPLPPSGDRQVGQKPVFYISPSRVKALQDLLKSGWGFGRPPVLRPC